MFKPDLKPRLVVQYYYSVVLTQPEKQGMKWSQKVYQKNHMLPLCQKVNLKLHPGWGKVEHAYKEECHKYFLCLKHVKGQNNQTSFQQGSLLRR